MNTALKEVIGAKARLDPEKGQKEIFVPAYFINLVF